MTPTLKFQSVLAHLDWIIFFLVLFVTFLSVWIGTRLKERETSETNMLELLLMGRKLTLPLFVGTLVATWYGGIFGVTKIAFEQGIFNFVTQGVFWYLTYLVFAFFVINRIHQYKAVTLPELIGKMVGPKSAKLSAFFNLFNVIPIAYTISIGLFIQTLFGIPLLASMIIGVTLVVLYSLYGGFRAIVFSDLIQFFVMCLSVLLVILFSISEFGGIDFLQLNLPERYFSVQGTEGWGQVILWGFIAVATLVDPNFYQRCFAAKSPQVAKKGIIISTVIWCLFDLCTTFGAMYARAVIPEADSSNAYLVYSLQVLPMGLKGFFLAGILATILSTLDSYLFVAGTTMSYDIASKKQSLMGHHLSIIAIAIFSIVLAVLFEGNIKLVWKTLGSYLSACLLLPVLVCYIRPGKIQDMQFITGSILGIIGTTYWKLIPPAPYGDMIDEFYVGTLSTALGLLIYPLIQKLKTR